jgi:hypothetical protein
LCAVLETLSLMGNLMNGDLLDSRRNGLSAGLIRRSLNSAASQMV